MLDDGGHVLHVLRTVPITAQPFRSRQKVGRGIHDSHMETLGCKVVASADQEVRLANPKLAISNP